MKKVIYIIAIFISPFIIAAKFVHAQNIQKDMFGFGYPSEIKHLGQNSKMLDVEQKTAGKSTQNPLRGNGMMFIQNKGQFIDINQQARPDILYKGLGNGADVYLRKSGISYVYSNIGEVIHEVDEQIEELEKAGTITVDNEQEKKQELMQKAIIKIHRVDMEFENCNSDIETINDDEVEGYNNYYYAHCPQGITNVKQYNKIIYKNIYKNIDVVYYGNKATGIKYDIIVQPHTNPDQIKLHWKWAESIRLNYEGNLVIKTAINEFYESIPKVYQIINGKIVDVKAKYILTPISPGEVILNFSFSIFNPNYSLIIDPWVSYYGGTGTDVGSGVTTDASGNVYVSGWTNSATSIASAGFQNILGVGTDAFLVKFNGVGTRLWATYYGGTGNDRGTSVTTDASGNVYMSGYTESTSGMASGGFQNAFGGTRDAFLVKFNGSTGGRIWATYYGGTGSDQSQCVTTDVFGNVYLSGQTASTAGISFGGFQNAYGGGFRDAFLVKFNGAGTRILATYYGGIGSDVAFGIAIDASGNIYLVGWTPGTMGIASGGFQNVFGGGTNDAFLVKFNAAGARIWATYYGGTGDDQGYSIVTDISGNVYMAGMTQSTTGIASGGFQNVFGGGNALAGDGFLVKFNGAGVRIWATYLGGSIADYAFSVAVDILTNDVYVSGDTYSSNFPVTSCAWQQTLAGGIAEDGFLASFTSAGNIICSSYVGGTDISDDEDCRMALYGCYVYMTGHTGGNYPVTPGAHQTVYGGGGRDSFVAQLYKNSCGFNKTVNLTASANNNSVCVNTSINFTGNFIISCNNSAVNYMWSFPGGSPSSSSAQNPTGVTYSAAGSYSAQLIASTPCDTDTVYVNVTIATCVNIAANVNSASMCSGTTPCPTLTAIGINGTAPYTYLWNTANITASISPCPANTTNYTVTITDSGGLTATSIAVLTVNPAISVITAAINITCNSGTDGSAIANSSGGTPGYIYSWSNAQTTQTISGLPQGNYVVTITDSKGCTATSTAAIVSPSPLVGQFTKGAANCPGCVCKEWLMVNAIGGTSPYSYSWPDGYVNRYKNQLCPGTYLINIKDKNGCSINVNLTAP